MSPELSGRGGRCGTGRAGRVYAEESTARTDARVLQRDVARAEHRARGVDCLPLQVFTEPQHTHR